jgi:uncharacterized membrane protein (DUF373 family)
MKQMVDGTKIGIFIITALLFGLSYYVGVSVVIIQTLSFLILMEIVRTIYEYVINPEHRVKVRYIIDGGILFGMRELFVGWVMLKTNLMLSLIIMSVSLIVIGALIFYRYKVIMSSPDQLEPGEYTKEN